MRSRWKLLLLCCLALALPVQGVAAVTMRMCAGHTGSHGPRVAAAGPAAHARHAEHSGEQSAAEHRCSACAACCIGMALTPSVPAWPAAAPAQAAFDEPDVAVPERTPDSLDRPPRTTRS